jgi:hypothetical protein
MRTNTEAIAGLGLLLAAANAMTGCSTLQPKNTQLTESWTPRLPRIFRTTQDLTGSEPREIKSNKAIYNREVITLHSHNYQAERNSFPRKGEANFVLRPEEVIRFTPLNSTGKVILTSDRVYVPERMDKKGNKFRTSGSLVTTGQYGVKAKINPVEITNPRRGVIHRDQRHVDFGLETMKISDEEFYIPKIEKTARIPGEPDFYLVPVSGTTVDVDLRNRKVTLTNDRGFYRLVSHDARDYAARKAPTTKKTEEKETLKTGEIE